MEKFMNWLLPLLMMVAAFIEEYFSLIKELIVSMHLAPAWNIALKLALGFLGIVILKLQHPSLKAAKKAKQAKEGYHPKV
jgi:hypothetical protein